MPGLKKISQTNWDWVKQDAASDASIAYDPETDLYDPNDSAQVIAFFSSAKVVRKPGRPMMTASLPADIILNRRFMNHWSAITAFTG
jgi:hypothetical protein